MPQLGTFDRARIENDIASTKELLDRNRSLLSVTSDATKVAELEAKVAELEQRLNHLNTYLL